MALGRTLGVDYGSRRIGLAVSDVLGMLATPRGMVEVTSDKQAVAAVVEAVDATQAERVVVGLPLNMDGTRGEMVARVEAFVERLGRRLQIPVIVWDERLSSSQVERALIEADVSRARRKRLIDKLAAQAILQNWLDAQALTAQDTAG